MKQRGGTISILAIALSVLVRASFDPMAPPPEVGTLLAVKNVPDDAVRISWSDGLGPFIVVRSETPDFSSSITIFYVSRDAVTPFDDPAVLSDGKTYYYQIFDSNSGPTQLALSASYAVIGDTLVIDGVGFDPADTHVFLEGIEIPITSCTPTQVTLAVPAMAASGQLTVISSNGVSEPRKFDKVYFSGHSDLTHVAVDTNHDAWVCERGTAPTSDKIYKVDHLTGGIQSWATLNECVGLPADSAGNHYVGNSLSTSTNRGSIWKVDTTGASTSWGVAGIVTTYPVYVRALAIDPGNNDPSNLTVYTLDGNNIDHSSSIIAAMATGHSIYLSIGSTISNPGGLAINGYRHMFYTQTTSIKEIDELKNFVFSYGSTFGVNNPAQMDFESVAGGSNKMWVANRGANNVLKISTDPANRHYLEKISGLTSPRGLAFDQDPTPDPNTGLNNCYLYVAEQTRFSRFRTYDTVWVHAVVLNESINQHTLTDNNGTVIFTLPATTKEAMEKQVQYDIRRANDTFKQAGIEVKLRDIQWISDPTSPADPANLQGITMHYDTAVLTDEETTLFATARSTFSAYDINVYYVAGLGHETNPSPPYIPDESYLFALWGFTYTDDWISGMNNSTQSAIVLCRAGLNRTGTSYYTRSQDASLAHELAHFLIDWGGSDEHSTVHGNLMNLNEARTAHTLDATQIDAIRNHTESPQFIDHF